MKQKCIFKAAIGMLCLCAMLLCSSCSFAKTDSAPNGMQTATAAGADFRLYVPTSWNLNTAYGISGAYYTLNNQSSVSVVKYPITGEMADAIKEEKNRTEWFFQNECYPQLENCTSGAIERHEADCVSTVLGGANARQFHYSATIEGKKLHFLQVIAEKNHAFYVFSFVANEELYAMLYADNRKESDVAKILKAFVFADPYVPAEPVKTLDEGAGAPEGMKLASNNDVAYRFHIPTDWSTDVNQTVYSALSPDQKASVSVVPYLPNGEVTSVVAYFEETQKMLERVTGGGYEEISYEAMTLGGGQAMRYDYTLTVGGEVYRYRQIVGNYKGMIYNLTYTAKNADFELHISEFEAIVNAFQYQ